MLRFRQELQDMTEAEFANHIQAVESMKLEKDKVRVCACVLIFSGSLSRKRAMYVCHCLCCNLQLNWIVFTSSHTYTLLPDDHPTTASVGRGV